MPRKNSRGPDGDLLDDNVMRQTALICFNCTAPDPEVRHLHYVKLLKERSLDVLRSHITEQYVTLRDHGSKRQDAVEAVMLWATNLVDQYSGMADPQTGAKMPWWQARQWLMDNRDTTAASAYTQAPEAYKAQNPTAGNLQPTVQHITTHLRTEPGDDDPLAI